MDCAAARRCWRFFNTRGCAHQECLTLTLVDGGEKRKIRSCADQPLLSQQAKECAKKKANANKKFWVFLPFPFFFQGSCSFSFTSSQPNHGTQQRSPQLIGATALFFTLFSKELNVFN